MTPAALRDRLAVLGLSQLQTARLLGVAPRTMRRWCLDERPIPEWAWRFLSVLDIPEARARLEAK